MKPCEMTTVYFPSPPLSSTATIISVQSLRLNLETNYHLLGSIWNIYSTVTLTICVSVWEEDSATRASSRQRCSSRMLEAIVTEKGVKALLWSLASSATERNCLEPSRMAERTWRAQARVWNDKTFLLPTFNTSFELMANFKNLWKSLSPARENSTPTIFSHNFKQYTTNSLFP